MTVSPSIAERNGMFSVMLRSCTTSILSQIVDPQVPFVWIRHHAPNSFLQWWKTSVPVSETSVAREIEVRSMEFDMQMSTSRFLELLPEFKGYGMELFQMTSRVPDTLTLEGIADELINQVLIKNGLHLRFYLPHSAEIAQLSSPSRDVLERALRQPLVREIAY